MRLILIAFFLFTIYQCASCKDEGTDIVLMEGMEINHYNGKKIKYIKVEGNNELFIYFTDNDTLHIASYRYPMHWEKP